MINISNCFKKQIYKRNMRSYINKNAINLITIVINAIDL